MKKSFIFVASVLAIALASCTEVLPEKEASDSGMNKIVFGIASEAITKTALLDDSGNPDPDGVSPYWQKGDQIRLEGDDSFPPEIYTLEKIGDSMHNEKVYECATYFNGNSPFYGVYPASSFVSRSGSSIMMNIPAKQSGNFKDAHFCAAQSYVGNSKGGYSRTYHLDFYPVAPILHFKKSDFSGYTQSESTKLTITGYLKGKDYCLEDQKTSTKGVSIREIAGDFEVTFDSTGKILSAIPKTGSDQYEIEVDINSSTPEDIYIALWPDIQTDEILFGYSYPVTGMQTTMWSKPVDGVILECNKIYPAFFGRRVSTILILNQFLGEKLTGADAHYLITKPTSGTISFSSYNHDHQIGLDFSSNISENQKIDFVAGSSDCCPSKLIIVATEGKNTTFTFDDFLLENTTITVNGDEVKSNPHVLL